MVANISKNYDGTVCFVSHTKPAWWGVGNKLYSANDKVNLIQATKDAEIGHYELVDPYVVWNGAYLEDVNRKAVIRVEPNGKTHFLDFVGKDYPILQNQTIAEIFNEVSLEFPVETVGALGKGEKVFWCLNGGDWEVNNKTGGKDIMHTYFVISDDKIGKQATKILLTPVRVVCQNTESLATEQANIRVNVWHKTDNEITLRNVADVILEMQKRQQAVKSLFDNMANSPYTTDEFKELITKKLFAKKENSDEHELFELGILIKDPLEDVMSMSTEQYTLMNLFAKYNDENHAFAETKWNAYNAITDHMDWRQTRGPQNTASSLFGNGSKKKSDSFSELMKGK